MTPPVAIVTGASRGIGRAVAIALARTGHRVAVLARTSEAATNTVAEIGATGGSALAVAADVAEWDQVEQAVRRVIGELGPVHVLVNNAGVDGQSGAIGGLDPRAFARTLAVNTLGPFHLMRAVVPGMLDRRRGVIVNLSSTAGSRPGSGRLAYGTSKAALDYLVTALAADAGGTGVRWHIFYPGPTATDLQAARMRESAMTDIQPQQRTSQAVQEPSEVAAAIAWLVSDAGLELDELVVRWRDTDVRDRIRRMPGFADARGVTP